MDLTCRCRVVLAIAIVFSIAILKAPRTVDAANHTIELQGPVLAAEEGLLLGNGDLSVSVYQTADRIVWRLGKGDVWDRRLELGENPKPTHIDELARGIEIEGWKCGPYGGPVEATRGTANPTRMREICQGSSASDVKYPYPCPKPVGELALHFPPDLPGMIIRQRLSIEEATLSIECAWSTGAKLHIVSFIPPKPNVLVVRWRVENWNAATRMGDKPPVWFSLYRWANPTIEAFAERFAAQCRHDAFHRYARGRNITPLPPPTTRKLDSGRWAIEQTFPADPLFKDGFDICWRRWRRKRSRSLRSP